MSTEDFLQRLSHVQQNTNGWTARCPAHDDQKSSLSITAGNQGRTLVNCHAGCSPDSICRALNLGLKDLFPDRPATSVKPKVVARYNYSDESGQVLFQTERMEPKGFRQRRPDPAKPGKWLYNLKGVPRVIYRLPEAIEALKAKRTIFVAEGEKDCDRLATAGFVATCNPMGADPGEGNRAGSKWLPQHTETLRGAARVIVIADKDEPGRRHARFVAAALKRVAESVRLIELPDRNGHAVKDVCDFFDADGTAADLKELVRTAPEFTPTAQSSSEQPSSTSDDSGTTTEPTSVQQRRSIATRLIELAAGLEFFHDPDGNAFVRLPIHSHIENWRVDSRRFRDYLAELYYRKQARAANRNSIADALMVLENRARFDGDESCTYLRVAPHANGVLLDLCDEKWRVLEISASGWKILESSPVPFIRTRNMRSLPVPATDGSLDSLWSLVNISLGQRPLVVGWLLNALNPHGPYPVADLNGEQGTAKTCAALVLRSIVDPSAVPLRSPPREERDLLVGAASNWVLVLDNLSTLPPWLSDGLCRIATGGGHSARQLYTDGEEFTISVKRPIILTGIEDVATRPDLAERSLQLELQPIPDDKRLPESALLQQFEAARPPILAALVSGVSCALRTASTIQLDRLPRMADAAIWATAAEVALGFEKNSFVTAYWDNLREGAVSSIAAHPVGLSVLDLLAKQAEWKGEPHQLLKTLNTLVTDQQRRSPAWPATPRSLSSALRRLAQAFRRAGIQAEFGKGNRRTIRLSKGAEFASFASPAPFTTAPADAGDTKDAESPSMPAPAVVADDELTPV